MQTVKKLRRAREGRSPFDRAVPISTCCRQAEPAPTCCRSAVPTATCYRRTEHETRRHKLERLISSFFRNTPKNSCLRCRLGQCRYTAWARGGFCKSHFPEKNRFPAGSAPEKSSIFSGGLVREAGLLITLSTRASSRYCPRGWRTRCTRRPPYRSGLRSPARRR